MPRVHQLHVTTLELHQKPTQSVSPPPVHLHIMESRKPEPGFYRYLYQAIGEDVGWVDRLHLSEEQLASRLQRPGQTLQVLYADGNPCGLAELDFSSTGEVHIAHFGLTPAWRGKSIGQFFFNWILHQSWTDKVLKTWTRYSEWDHPAGKRILDKNGFVPTGKSVEQRLVPDHIQAPAWGQA